MWPHIEDKVGVSIIDSIPHRQTEIVQKGQKSRNVVSFLYRGQNWEYIPYCHTEILSKVARSRNVASFLYNGKIEYLSIFHTVILKML